VRLGRADHPAGRLVRASAPADPASAGRRASATLTAALVLLSTLLATLILLARLEMKFLQVRGVGNAFIRTRQYPVAAA
jgi:hypothetical protein